MKLFLKRYCGSECLIEVYLIEIVYGCVNLKKWDRNQSVIYVTENADTWQFLINIIKYLCVA